MEEALDAWNEVKKKLSFKPGIPDRFPAEREVWMSSLGINVGFEQNGAGNNFSRPVLIVKKFNNHMFWSIPLSTKQKNLDFYFNYTDPHANKTSAILAQMKLISIKRLLRKMYDFDQDLFSSIKIKLKSFL
jgi:mRNA interferase MazF